MFKRYVMMLLDANDHEEVNRILCAVDREYQNEKMNWKDHELLFKLGGRIKLMEEYWDED